MSLIKVRTFDQRLTLINNPHITSGNRKVDYLSVLLDDTWEYEGLTVKASFHNGNSEKYIVELNSNDNLYHGLVPHEVEQFPGTLFIGIFGEADGDIVKTTNEIELIIEKGTETSGSYVFDLLSEIIQILQQTVSQELPDDATSEQVKEILTTELSEIIQFDEYYKAMCLLVNQYAPVFFEDDFDIFDSDGEFNTEANRLLTIRYLTRFLHEGSSAVGKNQTVENNIQTLLIELNPEAEIGEISEMIADISTIISQVKSDLKEETEIVSSVKSVYETFYIGDDENGNS